MRTSKRTGISFNVGAVLVVIFLVIAFIVSASAHAQTTCTKAGTFTFCSDGSTETDLGSVQVYNYSKPRAGAPSSSVDVGNFRFYDNGVTRNRIGNFDFYSNGTTCTHVGSFEHCDRRKP